MSYYNIHYINLLYYGYCVYNYGYIVYDAYYYGYKLIKYIYRDKPSQFKSDWCIV